MQFLLSEVEYAELNLKAERAREAVKHNLQRVCTLAARHVPVERSWSKDKPKEPWGCILDRSTGYCDGCPVTNECPHLYKEWSK